MYVWCLVKRPSHWSPKQGHATSDSQQASKPGSTDLGKGTSLFHITVEYYLTTAIHLQAVGGKTLGTSEETLVYFH